MPITDEEVMRLEEKAYEVRRLCLQITSWAGGSHIGGSLSQTDILVAIYHKFMRVDPKNPQWDDRDRFVLSKGHGGIGHAAVLGDLGFFDKELLKDFNKTGSAFGMHLDALKVPGVDASTGSLGHGLGIALGMAMGARHQGKTWHTYCVCSDGEQCEGTIWEGAMSGNQFKVTNLTVMLDRNMLMIDGFTEDIMSLEPLAKRWEAFGWYVQEIDGHDMRAICGAVENAHAETDRPSIVICRTVKGKGVDFMENKAEWHYGGLDSARLNEALASLDRSYGKA
ncbi:MAG: transketolase [Phycisphaerae bacterium]|nr:transketolase [Phycisphaerae bacterium]